MMVWCRKEKKPSNTKRENQRLCCCVTWPAKTEKTHEMELVAVFVWPQTLNCTKRDTWRTYKSAGSNSSEKTQSASHWIPCQKSGALCESVGWGTWGLIALLRPPSHLEGSTMPAGAKQPRHHTATTTRPSRVKDVVHPIWCGKLHKGIVWACYGDQGHAWRGSKTSSSHGRTVPSSQRHRREPMGVGKNHEEQLWWGPKASSIACRHAASRGKWPWCWLLSYGCGFDAPYCDCWSNHHSCGRFIWCQHVLAPAIEPNKSRNPPSAAHAAEIFPPRIRGP